MVTRNLDIGSADDKSTTRSDSTVPAHSVAQTEDDESHKGCGTRLLFTQKYTFVRRKGAPREAPKMPDPIPRLNTISGLRLGAAADCHNCKIVLDALVSYSSGRLSIDNIEQIEVLPGEEPITIIYRPGLDAGEGSNDSGLREVKLELFQLEGESCKCVHVSF